MSDLHHTLEASARLAASGRCWFCGAPCPGAERCADRDACLLRQLAPSGGLVDDPLSAESAAMLRAGIESGRSEPSVFLGSFADGNNEEEPTV